MLVLADPSVGARIIHGSLEALDGRRRVEDQDADRTAARTAFDHATPLPEVPGDATLKYKERSEPAAVAGTLTTLDQTATPDLEALPRPTSPRLLPASDRTAMSRAVPAPPKDDFPSALRLSHETNWLTPAMGAASLEPSEITGCNLDGRMDRSVWHSLDVGAWSTLQVLMGGREGAVTTAVTGRSAGCRRRSGPSVGRWPASVGPVHSRP